MVKREGFLNIHRENGKKKREENDGGKWVAYKNKHIIAVFLYFLYFFFA